MVESIETLRQEVEMLNSVEIDLMEQSKDARNRLLELEERIYEYNEQYKVQVAEVERIKSEIDEGQVNVQTAEDMLNSLGAE